MQVLVMLIGGLLGVLAGNILRKKMRLKFSPLYPRGLFAIATGILVPVAVTLITYTLLIKLDFSSDVGQTVFSTIRGMNFGIIFAIFFF